MEKSKIPSLNNKGREEEPEVANEQTAYLIELISLFNFCRMINNIIT